MRVKAHAEIRDYYSAAIQRHGATPFGVDWPDTATQYLRFVQLLRVCDFSKPFSINDLGCGYGALLEYLAFRHAESSVDYRGIDISPRMIEAATSLWKHRAVTSFFVGAECSEVADYSLASGVFNVCLGVGRLEWEDSIEQILRNLRKHSRLAFGVNFLLPLPSPDGKQGLYRTSPQRWLKFCKEELCCETEQIADYGLREFTLLARIPRGG